MRSTGLDKRKTICGQFAFIARDAPMTADAYVRRLRSAVDRLKAFPTAGSVVPELGREDIREVLSGNYRLIYRLSDYRVDILTVYQSARLLDVDDP